MKKVFIESLIGTIVALGLGMAMGWAGSQGGAQISNWSIFAICTGFAFSVQWLVFIPSLAYKTEHYYDLTGSLTYILVILAALILVGRYDLRSLLVASLGLIWAARLGSFLFARVKQAGSDRRFEKMLHRPMQFFMTWTIQGLWVVVTLSAGLAVLTGPQVELDLWAFVGALIWIIGFSIEVISDRQKTAFRKSDKEGFIQSGLWSWSRHPNYFGEIVLWLGIAVIAVPTLEGWRLVTLISPVFVCVLLTLISGVRMLETSAARRWGNDEAYKRYVASTSVLIPLPPR